MQREYIKIQHPSPLPILGDYFKPLDDDFWKNRIFHYLLQFYQNYDDKGLKKKLLIEKAKEFPRIEREIAKFLRVALNNDRTFNTHFWAFGENTNDEDVEGSYDITIHTSLWERKHFHFECKNLDGTQDLTNKYVYYNTYKKDFEKNNIFDGGVYRFFNGKYAQSQDFGGMIGFVLNGNVPNIKIAVINKLSEKFTISPEGDVMKIEDNSIFENSFTFSSVHSRLGKNFTIHHLLFDMPF